MAVNPYEKYYIRRDAAAAVAFIEEALRVAAAAAQYRCQRCNSVLTAEEFARSQQAFQRPYCDRCFDEVFLSRRNFETQVELNKTIEARDGTVVQSAGERTIADWLTARALPTAMMPSIASLATPNPAGFLSARAGCLY